MPKEKGSPLPEISRKDWLLLLWDYHHGGLPEPKMTRVNELLDQSEEAQVDSDRVSQIINELRQIGRWDPKPEFREEALAPLIQAGRPVLPVWLVPFIAVIAAVIFYLVWRFLTPVPATSNVDPLRIPPAQSSLDPSFVQNAPFETDLTPPDLKLGDAPELKLRDPVVEIESEMDDWLKAPLVVAPTTQASP